MHKRTPKFDGHATSTEEAQRRLSRKQAEAKRNAPRQYQHQADIVPEGLPKPARPVRGNRGSDTYSQTLTKNSDHVIQPAAAKGKRKTDSAYTRLINNEACKPVTR